MILKEPIKNLRCLLRLSEIAERLGVSHLTVRSWMKSKIIPYIQIKRLILFDESKVVRALNRYERHAVKPVTETPEGE